VATGVTPALGSSFERVEYSLTYLFASFNALYNLVHLMLQKEQLTFNFLCCALWSEKYGK